MSFNLQATHQQHEIIANVAQVEAVLTRFDRLVNWNTSLTSRDQFRDMLLSGKQLRIKFGADITAQTLHIGHAVNLRAMKHLQDLGHKVVFLLGGFTTLVGDPTDKLMVRTAPQKKAIEENKKAFIEQIKLVVRFDSPQLIEIRDNTEWWGTLEAPGTINVGRFFEMLKTLTVGSMLGRDMFRKRMENSLPIYLSEFLYPVLQGYDSVAMQSNVTIVGSDQMFNEKMAWSFQEAAGQAKQAILCTKITPGLDGGEKQSKSIGNYVGLAHSPQEKFNRVMLLLDGLIPEWFQVYTEVDPAAISELNNTLGSDPIALKKRLAFSIVELFHGAELAADAEKEFDAKKFRKRIPNEMPEIELNGISTVDELLRQHFRQKTNGLRDLISKQAIGLICKVNDDGTYQEHVFGALADLKNVTVIPGTILRWGKNQFFRMR